MATDFSRQFRRYPTAGSKIVADGAPLSTRVPLDLMYGVNNLERTCPMVGFVEGYLGSSSQGVLVEPSVGLLNVASGEFLVDQVPTVLPATGIPRFCWTLGMKFSNAPGHDVTVDAVNVYIASQPYTSPISTPTAYPGPYLGTTVTTAFGGPLGNSLARPYATSSIAPAYAIPASTSDVYKLFDNSDGTTGNMVPFSNPTHDGSALALVNLVVTISLSVDDATAHLGSVFARYMDFGFWTEPE